MKQPLATNVNSNPVTPRDTPKVSDKVLQKVMGAPGGLSRILSSINLANSPQGESPNQPAPDAQIAWEAKAEQALAMKKATVEEKKAAKEPIDIGRIRRVDVTYQHSTRRGQKSTTETAVVMVPIDGGLHVKCGDIEGEFINFSQRPTDYIIRRANGEEFTPSKFESLAFDKGRQWKKRITVKSVDSTHDIPVGDFLSALQAAAAKN